MFGPIFCDCFQIIPKLKRISPNIIFLNKTLLLILQIFISYRLNLLNFHFNLSHVLTIFRRNICRPLNISTDRIYPSAWQTFMIIDQTSKVGAEIKFHTVKVNFYLDMCTV